VDPIEREELSQLPIPGANVWGDDDFFSSTHNIGIDRVCRGKISAGETHFVAGDSIHEARNNCPDQSEFVTTSLGIYFVPKS
jgi:hypothetical protein